jgi:DNA-binding NarL/FixJ family response regulator
MSEQLKGAFPNARPTAREREVWRLIALGYLRKQIAADFGVCRQTIDKHAEALHRKLGTHSTRGLTLAAVKHGVVTLDEAIAA